MFELIFAIFITTLVIYGQGIAFNNYIIRNVNLNNNRDLIISDLEDMKVAENNRKLGNKNAQRIYEFLFN